MALSINTGAAPADGHIVADRRLWLTADKARVVEDGDRAACILMAIPGTPIPQAEAKRLGLTVDAGRIVLPGVASARQQDVTPKRKKG